MRTMAMTAAMALAIAAAGCMESFKYVEDADSATDWTGDTGGWDTSVTDSAGDPGGDDTPVDTHEDPVIDPVTDTFVDTLTDPHVDAVDGMHLDLDGDGFTPADGDCDDAAPGINPAAWDFTGNGLDEDCSGVPDDPRSGCDCATGVSLAAALELCDPRFLLGSAEYGDTAAMTAGRRAINRYGSATNGLVVRAGCSYALLDTGSIDPVTGGVCGTHRQPGTDFGCAGGKPDPDPGPSDGATICDVQQLEIDLVAPSNATGFSFDLVFISSEYPEWVSTEFKDTFYALLDRAGWPRTSITAGSDGEPLTVSSPLLEDPPVTSLAGTGYSDMVTDTSGMTVSCGSSTGWLRTSWPIAPGESFTLTFSIHDEGDGIFDSLVILDGLRWLSGPVTPGTVRI